LAPFFGLPLGAGGMMLLLPSPGEINVGHVSTNIIEQKEEKRNVVIFYVS
jgi:hypothetical protein